MRKISVFILFTFLLVGCEKDDMQTGKLDLLHVFVGSTEISLTEPITENLPVDRTITLIFSKQLDQGAATNATQLKANGQTVDKTISFASEGTTMVIYPAGSLSNNTIYTVELSDQLEGDKGEGFDGASVSFKTMIGSLSIVTIYVGEQNLNVSGTVRDVPLDEPIIVDFSVPVAKTAMENSVSWSGPGSPAAIVALSDDGKTASVSAAQPLDYLSRYTFNISNTLKGIAGESFSGFTKQFYTTVDETPKFPLLSEEDLLTKVQQQTFRYFWDFGHPVSGLARERNTSGDLVTTGGSGFGLMTIVVGIERGFITRQDGLARLDIILDFLETSDRFHGAWPHWINGNTGDVIPFSPNDNGGDLVETSYLIQGLITFRQYLNISDPSEQALINRINALWEDVEWDWFRRDGQDVLYWHWSPTVDWAMNHQIKGWNECLITYVLATSSPTHGTPKSVYDQGWAANGGMKNGNAYEEITLPLGPDYGGPLFFSQYSFLGLNTSLLSDTYGDYMVQNVNHSKINYKYCVRNPKDFVGYSEDCWGLTASDNHVGYSAHSPTNDLGVITPTAALSSFPYTPDESMRALKFFYYTMGDRLFGEYGFYDAFNVTEGWTADSFLAIDQGPIIIMIENYRTGLLWDLFMSAPEIQQGLATLGFTVSN